MLASLFEFLFKYRPVVFREGDFSLAAADALATGAVVAGLIAVVALLSYLGVRGKSRRLDRVVLGGLRFAGLAVLGFCLLRPALVVSTVVPQRNFVGVLLDDSRSMEIQDHDGRSRGSFLQETFGTPDHPIPSALSERFAVRYFRFSSRTERMEDVSEMSFMGSRTRLGPALDRARSELASVPLSGLVVLTDGADNSGEELTESLMALQARGVPVYTVGVGRERFERDIQVSRADPPRTVLAGSSVVVDVVVTHSGYEGETVSLIVEDEGQIVSTREVELPDEGQPVTVPVRFTASTPGARAYTFRIPVDEAEQVARNNSQTALVSVEDRREKILYFEGEPRYEVGFMGRAVADDDNLQLVVLQRTAENKFLRLNVDDGEELQGGFPNTRAELYAYRSLVLGTVEASFFTGDQLQMIADFVDKRGGSLLALGGRNSFARGGYAGTPLADVLPVVFSDEDARPDGYHAFVSVEPTQAGLGVPALQLAGTEEESAARWSELPPLLTYNPLHRVKPGATTLLRGIADDLDEEHVALAHQRYGAGKSLSLAVQDTWIWQMQLPLEDATHETFWRQMLRWLVDGVPDRVTAEVPRDRVEPGESVALTATVNDSTYLGMSNSVVEATVTTPLGEELELGMDWVVDGNAGEYATDFVPTEEGLHTLTVRAYDGDDLIGVDEAFFQVAPQPSEYFDAGARTPLLERIASETGGIFYTPETVAALPEDLRVTGAGVTTVEEMDLWDMPVLLLVLLGLILCEWGYRRARGLV